MFQTEPIIFIQSLGNSLLTFIFKYISELGTISVLSILLIMVMFGIDFKKGFMFIQVALLTATLVTIFKSFFSLPRPFMVDSNVKLPGEGDAFKTPFTSRGASSFFGQIPADVIDYFRRVPGSDWGFPSGHTAGAVALWGSVFNRFRVRWVRVLALLLMLLIPLSRLYLGMHFIADIIGGLVIGSVVLLAFYLFIFKHERLMELLSLRYTKERDDLRKSFLWLYLLLAPVMFAFIPGVNLKVVGFWLGANLSFMIISGRGLPKDEAPAGKRILRVVLVAALFTGLRFSFKYLLNLSGLESSAFAGLVSSALILLLAFVTGTELSIRLKLFHGRERNPA